MWLAILLIAPIAIIVQAHYLSREVTGAVTVLWPRARRGAAIARRAYLTLSYSVPALLIVYVAYVLIARPETGPPSHWAVEYLVLLPFWFATAFTTQCVVLIAPIHLVRFAVDRFRPANRRRLVAYRWAVVAIAGFFAVYMPIRIAIDSGALEVRHHRVAIADLPPELDGFEIALVSDPQADIFTSTARIGDMVRAVNAEEPDLVLIAGDIITRDPAYIEPAAAALGELSARRGVFSAIGDHDNFAYRDRGRSVSEIREALARHGIALDDNRVHRFGDLAVVVATHNYINRITPDEARAVIAEAGDAAAVVLVAHQVGDVLLDAAREAGVDLYLAGHTHGGQVRLWWPGFDIVAARIESPYITGRYRGPVELIVSSGLGVSVLPFRYRAPPTVDIIELVGD